MNEARSSRPVIDGDAAAALMEPLTDLVVRAGAAILAINRVGMQVDGKADGSPVTEADLAADRIIGDGLARLVPGVPALSEERVHPAKPPYRGSFFLIDPLDGTKEFVAGRDEFTVNLALVTDATPILGIIGAPALGLLWRRGVGQPAGPGANSGAGGGGGADFYPRLAPTSEWDVAAGHAVVTAAGGRLTDASGKDLRFGEQREGFIVPEFIAWGDPSAAP